MDEDEDEDEGDEADLEGGMIDEGIDEDEDVEEGEVLEHLEGGQNPGGALPGPDDDGHGRGE